VCHLVPALLEPADDVADEAALHAVGFDHDVRALARHHRGRDSGAGRRSRMLKGRRRRPEGGRARCDGEQETRAKHRSKISARRAAFSDVSLPRGKFSSPRRREARLA